MKTGTPVPVSIHRQLKQFVARQARSVRIKLPLESNLGCLILALG
jgi:hypothetical protein